MDCSVNLFVSWSASYSTSQSVTHSGSLSVRSFGKSARQSTIYLKDLLVSWQVDQSVDYLVSWSVKKSIGKLASLSVGRTLSLSAGQSAS